MPLEPLNLTPIRHELMAEQQAAPKAIQKREVLLPQQLMSAFGGSFKAAQVNRLNADWFSTILSADQELFSNLRVLRARSRLLAKNNQHAAKFLRQCEKNIIGKDGITFQAKVKKQRGEGLLEQVNDELERAYNDWSKPDYCTVEGKMSRASVERFFIRQVAMDGEVIIRKVPLPGNPYLFALQFMDPDQLDHTFFLNRLPNGNEIRMGVEVDQYKRPVAYWLWRNHPSEVTQSPNERIRIPASEILHCFLPLRVGQTRGVPWMTPAMVEMNMLGGYKEAEVTAARISASKMGFFTSQTGDQYTGDPALSQGNVQASGMAGQGMPLMDSSPGSFESLPAGMDFKPWDPQHPNQAYDAFVRECLRGVAAGLDVPYHELGQDLASVNFSSIRAGLLDARDTWQLLQQWTIDSLCQPVYAAWLGNAILAGSLNLDPQGIPQYKDGAEWHARGWDWVDPLKDVSADVLAIDNGMTTLTRVLAKRGLDFEEIVNERKRELDRIKELGLTLGADLKGDSTAPVVPGAEDEEDGTKPVNGKPNGKANGREYHA
jgi:lambda family phage portal protein